MVIFFAAAVAAGGLGALRLGQRWGTARDRRRIPPRGEIVCSGGHGFHVLRQGPAAAPGSPTVVFEAALAASSLSWVYVQEALAASTPTFSYDRAGMGWSDAGPLPRTWERQVDELRTLLRDCRIAPPYLLVGHSYGALLMRLFAARYRDEVRGLVLVDGPSLAEWAQPDAAHQARLATGVRLARRGALAARWGVARAAAALIALGAHACGRWCVTAASGGILRSRDRMSFAPILKLPPALQPHIRAGWVQPRFYRALGSQLENLPPAARAAAACAPLEDLALVVLTAAAPDDARRREQDATAAQSCRGAHRIAQNCGHWIPLEDPELIVAAVRHVLAPQNAAAVPAR